MLTHDEMIGLQAEKHDLIDPAAFRTGEEFILHLIHSFAYHQVTRLAESKSILDLGCNTGYGSAILSRVAEQVVGVDVSESALALARTKYARPNVEYRLIDGKRLPFPDHTFDVVVSCQVIEHIVDCKVFLAEVTRVVAKSGVVIFTTPNATLRLTPGMKPWNRFHVREFNACELRATLDSSFSCVQVLGLFAEDEVYKTEINRVARARLHGENRDRSNRGPMNRALSMMFKPIPGPMRVFLERLGGKHRRVLDRDFVTRHGLFDFFYKASNSSAALDLMALCAGDIHILNRATRAILTVDRPSGVRLRQSRPLDRP